MGFDEIQFDYVRFPDKGKLSLIDYKEYEGADRNQAIADFLQYATDVLSPYGVRISADIFGQVTISRTGEGVGPSAGNPGGCLRRAFSDGVSVSPFT